jgi:hypothetical protein
VQEAADLFDKKEYAKAKELLDPMVKDKSDLDAMKKAVELLIKVEEALKAK